ncbi:hypothetical protein BS50DRAFT_641526 [Corynespora cassiicola Philippines]|uniref:Uncharacterized protein n=1 Tax=Corynespora cassiicola Philippines TaxID=1448308 RepID=A0A2T2MZV9_CORCC|nr:hypothetical protein BS50DRAFT_641526 [Corynespora cassiicola Philippines]
MAHPPPQGLRDGSWIDIENFYTHGFHGDPAILLDSRCWHTASLNFQRLSVAKIDKDTIPSAEEVLVQVILGLYELSREYVRNARA